MIRLPTLTAIAGGTVIIARTAPYPRDQSPARQANGPLAATATLGIAPAGNPPGTSVTKDPAPT
jgi:hypothetical protein